MNDTQSADLEFLRRAIDLARSARSHGNHPFGALLVDGAGNLVLEAENTVVTQRDSTGHAETNLVRLASQKYDRDFLATCTLYTSTEPCAMCAGAVYWSGIGRIVYGLSESRLIQLTGANPENPTLQLPCRTVFAAGQRSIQVTGPLLEPEAEVVHKGFW